MNPECRVGYDFRGLNISVGYYSNVQKLAGGKNM